MVGRAARFAREGDADPEATFLRRDFVAEVDGATAAFKLLRARAASVATFLFTDPDLGARTAFWEGVAFFR